MKKHFNPIFKKKKKKHYYRLTCFLAKMVYKFTSSYCYGLQRGLWSNTLIWCSNLILPSFQRSHFEFHMFIIVICWKTKPEGQKPNIHNSLSLHPVHINAKVITTRQTSSNKVCLKSIWWSCNSKKLSKSH